MDKYFYYAVTIKENGRYYSYTVKASQSDNLLCVMAIHNVATVTPCPSKKFADKLVSIWNEAYKRNGTYMYSDFDI